VVGLFKLLGFLLACYVLRALSTGEVYARSGIWGRTFRRDEQPWSYRSAVVAYAMLSIALMFVFFRAVAP
jgi:hypothetical protein